jgi:SET domain-containing protein
MPKPLVRKWTFLEDDLRIKKSLIPGTGKGVFTKVDIEKETIVTEFTGEKISHTVALGRFILKESHSLLYLNKTYSIDSLKDKECIATYINDANGPAKLPGTKNNTAIIVARGRLFVIAKRNIKAGEELFINYGINYWKAFKHYKFFLIK